MKAVLLMAHGAPADLNEVEEYVLHIRHGRPLPPDQMAAIKDRYRQVGGSPLADITNRQAAALQERLGENVKVYVGFRHSKPFISDTVNVMRNDGITSIVAACMAPQFSRLSIGAYETALKDAIGPYQQNAISYQLIQSYSRHPKLIGAFGERLNAARNQFPSAFVIFTAHSLPEKILQEGDSYDFEVKETARLVANYCMLPDWKFAYQSQGLTSDKWLGPTVESRIDELNEKGIREIVLAPIGFVCDHVEILYDIDIAFRDYAQNKNIFLTRTSSLNDGPDFIELLFTLVGERL